MSILPALTLEEFNNIKAQALVRYKKGYRNQSFIIGSGANIKMVIIRGNKFINKVRI